MQFNCPSELSMDNKTPLKYKYHIVIYNRYVYMYIVQAFPVSGQGQIKT